MSITLVPASVAAQRPMTLTIRIWMVEDAPVTQVTVEILDARTGKAFASGTTDGDGQVRFEHLVPAPVRVSIRGVRPDGTPLMQVGQDQDGIWVKLPESDWVMELRVDVDGTVFPALDAVGAADGLDATAIANGTFGSIPTSPDTTLNMRVVTPSRLTTTALAPQSTKPTVPGATNAQDALLLPGVALLILLLGLTVITAAAAWRGKL